MHLRGWLKHMVHSFFEHMDKMNNNNKIESDKCSSICHLGAKMGYLNVNFTPLLTI